MPLLLRRTWVALASLPGMASARVFTVLVFGSLVAELTAQKLKSAAAPAPTTTVNQDELNALAVRKQLSVCATAGLQCRRGSWLYGDYKSMDHIQDIASCNAACKADPQCYHWNFHASQGGGCDLKTSGTAGFNEDASDWVSGSVVRAAADLPAGDDAELVSTSREL